jgi:hypothetical protein
MYTTVSCGPSVATGSGRDDQGVCVRVTTNVLADSESRCVVRFQSGSFHAEERPAHKSLRKTSHTVDVDQRHHAHGIAANERTPNSNVVKPL